MVVAIIPARMGSTRLKQKPLIPLLGRPLIQWTALRARTAKKVDRVIVATDSEEIAKLARAVNGVEVVMTPSELPSGSDRVAYVAKNFSDDDLILNLQGDEPCMPADVLDKMISAFPVWADVGTIAGVFRGDEEFVTPHFVKVLVDLNGRAMYFSRNQIPYGDDGWKMAYRHAGVYLYRQKALKRFAQLPRGKWEIAENLEQLRLMEQGASYYCWVGDFFHHEVNTPEDIQKAENILKASGGWHEP